MAVRFGTRALPALHIGAPAVIQESMVEICAIVRQARGMVLVVEHICGIRAVVQPVTAAFTALLSRLVEGLPGTTRVIVRQPAMTPVVAGIALTMRACRPVVFRRSTWGLPL